MFRKFKKLLLLSKLRLYEIPVRYLLEYKFNDESSPDHSIIIQPKKRS